MLLITLMLTMAANRIYQCQFVKFAIGKSKITLRKANDKAQQPFVKPAGYVSKIFPKLLPFYSKPSLDWVKQVVDPRVTHFFIALNYRRHVPSNFTNQAVGTSKPVGISIRKKNGNRKAIFSVVRNFMLKLMLI